MSSSNGRASLTVGPKTEETDRNWAVIDGLEPDTPYAYHVLVKGQKIGEGRVRTYPERADKLAFFVIGDYGNGAPAQYAIAKAMSEEAARRRDSDNPVASFVLTTGDNIYADGSLGFLSIRSGDADRHWERKFIQPYEKVIAEIPFYPTLGNHDGNASENRGDLWVYLDNFFFPRNKPARWYTFSFGGLADFFALDTTDIAGARPSTGRIHSERGAIYLVEAKVLWRIQRRPGKFHIFITRRLTQVLAMSRAWTRSGTSWTCSQGPGSRWF